MKPHHQPLSFIQATLFLLLTVFAMQHLTVENANAIASGNVTDYTALLAIKSKLIDRDPNGVLSLWNDSLHHCFWEGVTCGLKHNRVIVLKLYAKGLEGTISPFIGNMSFLRIINRLQGQIPPEIGRRVLKSTIIPIVCSFVGVLAVATCIWLYLTFYSKKRKSNSANAQERESFLKVSYDMLLKATDGFSPSTLLGSGTFGSVFKGILDGETVAIKVLNLQQRGGSKSFMAECEALRNIRHRNLVRIITTCSGMDFQTNDFKNKRVVVED